MFLTISDAAKAKLTQRLTPQTKIVLDFDDGVGPFSDAGMCTLDVAFNIILCESDQITNDFDQKIDSTLGPVYIKGYTATQMDSDMTLSVDKYLRYSLAGPSGTLDSNVGLRDLQTA